MDSILRTQQKQASRNSFEILTRPSGCLEISTYVQETNRDLARIVKLTAKVVVKVIAMVAVRVIVKVAVRW